MVAGISNRHSQSNVCPPQQEGFYEVIDVRALKMHSDNLTGSPGNCMIYIVILLLSRDYKHCWQITIIQVLQLIMVVHNNNHQPHQRRCHSLLVTQDFHIAPELDCTFFDQPQVDAYSSVPTNPEHISSTSLTWAEIQKSIIHNCPHFWSTKMFAGFRSRCTTLSLCIIKATTSINSFACMFEQFEASILI